MADKERKEVMLEFMIVYYLIGVILTACVLVTNDIKGYFILPIDVILMCILLPIIWLPMFIGGLFIND
jgi:uncharacterized membrane protein YhdT